MKKTNHLSLLLTGISLFLVSGCNEQARIIAIDDVFDFDKLNDVTYELLDDGSLISHVEGHNIADGDYQISSSLLSITKNYLVTLVPGKYDYLVHYPEYAEKISLTILDKHNQNRLVNGGFEINNYFGWTTKTVFKGESNLLSFANEAVVLNAAISGGEETYGGSGDYVYGLPDGMAKATWEEKMGHLVSSDFVLGGSGYISFQMGGGKNSDLNYISVIDNADGKELGRYGNHLFDAELSGMQNAILHPYFADLSSHIGKSMHLEVFDLGGRDWNFLCLDSFETYHDTTPTNMNLAIDIKPSASQSYTPNQLVNGDFANGLEGWTSSEALGWQKNDGTSQTWRVSSGVLKSDLSGDSARGLIRSSLFRVDGSGVVSLEIGAAQGSRYDKDTFVSIKEKNTNREIIRFANSRHNGIVMVKYYVDLSEYIGSSLYFEIVDNATGSYDTIFIDNIITYYQTRPAFDYGDAVVALNY